MWRTPPDTDPKPGAHGALVAVAAVVAIGLLVFGTNELYVSLLAPAPEELSWLKAQQSADSGPLPAVTDSDVVTLRRGQCFGSCPAYEVTIRGSGTIEFTGDAYVCRRHVMVAATDLAAVARLFRGLEVANFGAMPSDEHRDATDGATVAITLSRQGSAHTVRHYDGDRHAPRILTLIEQRIDKLAGTAAWTGTPADGTVNCALSNGRRAPIARDVPADGSS